ncbi:transcriptional regulatory [Fusarium denticulatum]|uniref:Transcriptional regulatory n=1 Tax=Fusarium denticulatum TaxID=48507 RepID=A0A8H5U2I4_9HYPO|nr:transcriptional regulatory [Fusarium denticulatum]
MPNPRSVRSSQRSVLACTNCSRRKIKCSKTIPCTACVRQNKAAQCQREPVAVVSRRSVGRSRAETTLNDPPPAVVPVPEATSLATVSPTSVEEVSTGTTVDPIVGSTAASSNDSLPQVDERMIEQLLASLSTPDTRLTNDAAAMLEFLTHGRRNILNKFIGRESISTSVTQPVQKWDTFLPVEQARSLLVLHEKHLAWMHNTVHIPTFIREFDENVFKIECDRNWIALYYALLSQTLYHLDNDFLYSLPQPITVAHNFDKSDLICILVSAAIRIAQCLNLHRLGLNDPDVSVNDAVDGEIRKRVWWFLVRYDWLQIPYQNTCQIHYSQFNTPMPSNCHDDGKRMIRDGRIDMQPAEITTITTWTNCLAQMSIVMWRHHDRMLKAGAQTDDMDRRYDEVIRADEEIKSLYLSWSDTLRDVNAAPSHNPANDGLPTDLMPAMLLLSIAQKVAKTNDVPVFMADEFDRSLLFIVNSNCRAFVTGDTPTLNCSITLLFALLFKTQNALTHDWERLRAYVEFGNNFLGEEAQGSSIARRGVRLLSALMELERTSGFSSDIEADIGDTIRRVALADEDGIKANLGEGHQMVFPYGQDLWESLMRDPTEDELM